MAAAGPVHCYSYKPLQENQIRVLDLFPGLPGEALRCKITHVEFPPLRSSAGRLGSQSGGSGSSQEGGETAGDLVEGGGQLIAESFVDHQDNISSLGNEDDEDTVSIVESEISAPPDYEALSYVWGPQDSPHNLYVDGENSGLAKIGPNLHDALQQLRPRPGQDARTLWVDQICICQSDLSERNAHIFKIGDVFRAARKVLVWLGQEDEHTALGFDFARSLYELSVHEEEIYFLSEELEPLRKLCRDFEMRLPKKYMDHHLEYYGNKLVDDGILAWCAAATRKISYRDWFDRAWTYEELKLSKHAELICGSQSLPWMFFERLLSYDILREFYKPRQEGLELTNYLNWFSQSYAFGDSYHRYQRSLGTLRRLRRSSKCSDPRDKVIALLAIADDLANERGSPGSKPASEFIRPDYRKPVEDLYLETAHFIVQESRSLELLDAVCTRATQDSLPSWVPDWRHFNEPTFNLRERREEEIDSVCSTMFRQATRGSSHSTYLYCNATKRSKLKVSGIKQDCVSALSCYDQNFVEEFFDVPYDTEIYPPTMQPRHQAIKQTMMRERWVDTSHPARAAFLGLNSNITAEEEFQEDDASGKTFEEELAYLDYEYRARDPRIQAFRSSKGFIGFAQAKVQIGDEIYRLLGSDSPVILRPAEGGYKFMGFCYVHGIMYGEGLHPDRRPLTCYYPGSSDVHEYWPLDWEERRSREENADRSPRSCTIEAGESSTYEIFEDILPYLVGKGYVLHPDWEPPWTPPGEDSSWLFERGFNPIPILTEDILLV